MKKLVKCRRTGDLLHRELLDVLAGQEAEPDSSNRSGHGLRDIHPADCAWDHARLYNSRISASRVGVVWRSDGQVL